MKRTWILSALSFLLLLAVAVLTVTISESHMLHAKAQTTLGGPLPGLTNGQMQHFTTGMTQFEFQWDPAHGLGPVYIQNSCVSCHNQPVAGGDNPSKGTITYFGALNSDGSFNPLTDEGGYLLQPLSVSKFIGGCLLPGEVIPPDATVVVKRLSRDLFGAGLVDAIADSDIIANSGPKGMGIDGVPDMVTDYNGQTRVGHFGERAEFASLLQTTGFTFGHFIGITNPVDPVEDCPSGNCSIPPQCQKSRTPNDPQGVETIQIFEYETYLAPNTAGIGNENGKALFSSIGCSLCHTPSYTTPANVTIPIDFKGDRSQPIAALSNQTVALYSDLLLHDMGSGLSDPVTFGMAVPSQWKTTPLWGLSTRTRYLHDGRTNNLTTAIQDHGGEAQQVITNFNALSPQDQADLLAFIDSL